MRPFFLLILSSCLLAACAGPRGDVHTPSLNAAEFQGFDFSKAAGRPTVELSGYEYQSTAGAAIYVETCEQAAGMNPASIAEFEYFRFRQLLLSCTAVDLYSRATKSHLTHFPESFNAAFYEALPATVIPLLSDAEYDQRKGQTLIEQHEDIVVVKETDVTAKAVTGEDEIFISVLGRGDFDEDGIEDLLLKTERFGVNSFGKHLDLILLSKETHKGPPEISWRWNPVP